MENTITWLLIADASKARLYATHKAKLIAEPNNTKNLQLIGSFTHEESRMKGIELAADKSGRFGNATFAEATSPKAREAEVFAHQLMQQLDAGRRQNHYRDLILVAPPHFMGMLDKHMPQELQKLVNQRIEKDYTQHNDKDLMRDLLHFL